MVQLRVEERRCGLLRTWSHWITLYSAGGEKRNGEISGHGREQNCENYATLLPPLRLNFFIERRRGGRPVAPPSFDNPSCRERTTTTTTASHFPSLFPRRRSDDYAALKHPPDDVGRDSRGRRRIDQSPLILNL